MTRPYIVMDTEYTTWPGARERRWKGPGERREILQIAALKIDAQGREVDRFLRYVKPVFNPVLSELTVELTGITQEKVDREGLPFVEVLSQYVDFVGDLGCWCYGRDDAILKENAEWFDADFNARLYYDARALVAACGHDPADWSSGSVHQLVGAPRPGEREHDALDDCLSLDLFVKGVKVALPVGAAVSRVA
ncbi:exonuclease domain-containing protein [Agrobacterium rubi]|nr:exonuclease domain-containing protein [Agrobacterium rubi]NTF24795.1 exonuclease domain-containing protein [Agrobacterium rubi]